MSMDLQESRERYNESLKRAVSCCKELAALKKFDTWKNIAVSLEGLRLKGATMMKAKSEGRGEIERQIKQYQTQVNGDVQ